jgi:polynucleotide 5'-kinase involved in rRNA processing
MDDTSPKAQREAIFLSKMSRSWSDGKSMVEESDHATPTAIALLGSTGSGKTSLVIFCRAFTNTRADVSCSMAWS